MLLTRGTPNEDVVYVNWNSRSAIEDLCHILKDLWCRRNSERKTLEAESSNRSAERADVRCFFIQEDLAETSVGV